MLKLENQANVERRVRTGLTFSRTHSHLERGGLSQGISELKRTVLAGLGPVGDGVAPVDGYIDGGFLRQGKINPQAGVIAIIEFQSAGATIILTTQVRSEPQL